MWICFNNAFVSIVQDAQEPGNLLVRARAKKHLTALFPRRRVTRTPKADYRWRVSMPAKAVAALVAAKINGIDYGNFKDSVEDAKLHEMYALWWGDHYKFQGFQGDQ
jgi:hypothetical protein